MISLVTSQADSVPSKPVFLHELACSPSSISFASEAKCNAIESSRNIFHHSCFLCSVNINTVALVISRIIVYSFVCSSADMMYHQVIKLDGSTIKVDIIDVSTSVQVNLTKI